jgi:hypothetical protein
VAGSGTKPQTVYDVWKPPEQRPLRHLPGLLGSSLVLLWAAAYQTAATAGWNAG